MKEYEIQSFLFDFKSGYVKLFLVGNPSNEEVRAYVPMGAFGASDLDAGKVVDTELLIIKDGIGRWKHELMDELKKKSEEMERITSILKRME